MKHETNEAKVWVALSFLGQLEVAPVTFFPLPSYELDVE